MSFNHPYFIFWAWHGTSHPWIWHHQDYMVLCFLHYSGSFEQINKNIKTLGKNDGNYCSVSCHLHPDSSVLKWMQILFQPENLSEFFWILAASEFTHPLFCINLIELHRGEKTSSSWGWKKKFGFTFELPQHYASITHPLEGEYTFLNQSHSHSLPLRRFSLPWRKPAFAHRHRKAAADLQQELESRRSCPCISCMVPLHFPHLCVLTGLGRTGEGETVNAVNYMLIIIYISNSADAREMQW